MIHKITTLVSDNKNSIARKALVLGGVTIGLAIGALLSKPTDIVVVEETFEANPSESTEAPDSK